MVAIPGSCAGVGVGLSHHRQPQLLLEQRWKNYIIEFCYYQYILIFCWFLSGFVLHEKILIWCVLDMVSSWWWWWWGFNRLGDIHLQYPAASIFIVKREQGCDSFLLLSSDSLVLMVWDPIYTAIRWNHFYKEVLWKNWLKVVFVEESKSETRLS